MPLASNLSESLATAQSLQDAGSLLVLIGVALELTELAIKLEESERFCIWFRDSIDDASLKILQWFVGFLKQKKLPAEAFSVALIILGLSLEIKYTGEANRISAAENAILYDKSALATKEAAQANERALENELTAKQLEIRLNETKAQLANAEARLNESISNLREENLPMDIGEGNSFAETLKSRAGIGVELRTLADAKSQKTADSLRSMFILAGWPILNFKPIGEVGDDGVAIGFNKSDSSAEMAALCLSKLLTERCVPSILINDPIRVLDVPTNTIIVAVMQRPTKLKADFMLIRAKETILRNEYNVAGARLEEILRSPRTDGAEIPGLIERLQKLKAELDELSKKDKDLSDQLHESEFGANSDSPSVKIHNSTMSINGTVVRGGVTNKLIIPRAYFDSEPLR